MAQKGHDPCRSVFCRPAVFPCPLYFSLRRSVFTRAALFFLSRAAVFPRTAVFLVLCLYVFSSTPLSICPTVCPKIKHEFYTVYIYIVFISLVCSVAGVLPKYSPAVQSNVLTRDKVIEKYFILGLNAPEILGFIVNVHGISLSLRQLKRVLRNRGCRRRRSPNSI